MKTFIKKCLITLTLAASLGTVSIATFYSANAYACPHKKECKWVPGHKRHGEWIPGHKVCWSKGDHYYGKDHKKCKWVPGHERHGEWIPGHKVCWM